MPKSSLQVTRGLKSRDKTVAVSGIGDAEDAALSRVRELVDKAVGH